MDKTKLTWLLIALLIILAVLYRTHYVYPHHPDHFTWGEYTNVVIDLGYAPWILHPLSLFGYYPLSIPSGFEYFFATFSELTGIDIIPLLFGMSIFFGLFGGLTLYLLVKKLFDHNIAMLASFILLTLAFYSKVTSNTGSNRIFNIVLYPLFILILFYVYETKGAVRWKWIVTGIIFFIGLALIHRMAQLSIIFIFALIGAHLIINLLRLHEDTLRYDWYARIVKYYEQNIKFLIGDALFLVILYGTWKYSKSLVVTAVFMIGLIAFYLMARHTGYLNASFFIMPFFPIIEKIVDLTYRERLPVYHQRGMEFINEYFNWYIFWALVALAIICLAVLAFILLRRKQILSWGLNTFEENRHNLTYDRIVNIGLTLALLYFSIYTFSKGGFFNMDRDYYFSSLLLEGTSSITVFINFMLNLNNNLSILIWFIFPAFYFLVWKEGRSIHELFVYLSLMLLTQIMLDWEYARLFMNPIYATLIAYGIYHTASALAEKYPLRRILVASGLVALLCVHMVFSTAFMHRDEVFEMAGISDKRFTIPEPEYIAAGTYLGRHDDFSIYGSDEAIRFQRVAYYAKTYEAVVAQSVYTDNAKLNIQPLGTEFFQDRFESGEKITSFYVMHDWLRGGNYYHGKHIFHLINNRWTDQYAVDTLDLYHIQYMLDNEHVTDKTPFFLSIRDYKNRIYDSPEIQIYALRGGFTRE